MTRASSCALLALLALACGTPDAPRVSDPPAADLDPACRDPHANVRGEIALPEGVTADPRPREEVLAASAAWDLPEGVTFTIGPPVIAGDRVTLRGEVTNTTATAQTLMLSEAGAGYFQATLIAPGLARRPLPPAAAVGPSPPALFPEPHAFTLAPGARWPLTTTIVLSCWEPAAPGRAASVHWWLLVEGQALEGDVPVVLGRDTP